jgi:hypothetical protein
MHLHIPPDMYIFYRWLLKSERYVPPDSMFFVIAMPVYTGKNIRTGHA